ncbi:MAG: hypothetical protein RL733_1322, partial [Actinomycetota bacterium]
LELVIYWGRLALKSLDRGQMKAEISFNIAPCYDWALVWKGIGKRGEKD